MVGQFIGLMLTLPFILNECANGVVRFRQGSEPDKNGMWFDSRAKFNSAGLPHKPAPGRQELSDLGGRLRADRV